MGQDLELSPATRAALTKGADVDLRGPACVARNSGSDHLFIVRNERADLGARFAGLHKYQDKVTVTAISTDTMTVIPAAKVDTVISCIESTLGPCDERYQDSLVGPLATCILERLSEAEPRK